ncbi:dnaJ domain-containing protein [Ditylenchus destructor]|uniref:DnaJ domain-containing protein n=1 Tax=Ditylenchus destructor TaxID=166010 RepID=A0AAD4N1W4_9BILA|nr:dnaJ domain-containing protein [Ditylenchus destructor]
MHICNFLNKGIMHPFYLLLFVSIFSLVIASSPSDPYSVLGIPGSASQREIKQAYKRLAMEWHPDKNSSPEAGDKFMEINQAYEFNFAFGGFGGKSSSSFHAHRITLRMYTTSLLEKSYTQPFIIYAYSSYCQVCFMLEPVWKDAIKDLEALGYGIGTANYATDGGLFEKLRISHLPSIVVLVEGRVIHYRGSMNALNPKTIRVFARDAIPVTYLSKLNTYTALRRFLDQWEPTNKASVLMVASTEEPKLRYLLAAMKFSHFARFAYVNINNGHTDVNEMKRALGIQCSECEHIFIFKENPELGPVVRLTSDNRQLSTEEISELIHKNKFLQLPRLSSMGFFDDLCPVSSRSLRHFCIILPVFDTSDEKEYTKAMRKFVQTYSDQLSTERVHISSIFVNKQRQFMDEFKHVRSTYEENRSILVLWRFEYVKAKYLWLPNIWSTKPENMHKSFETLREHIYLLARGTLKMDHTARINHLTDEYIPNWFTQISRTIVRMAETVWFHITREEALPVISVVGTLFFIFVVGYWLNWLVSDSAKQKQFQQEKPQFGTEQKEWHPEDPKTQSTHRSSTSTGTTKASSCTAKQRIWREMEPMIHELRAETYFGLIRLLKPGCRSIIILVDPESKDILLSQFARYIHPLRNNKTFSFGFLMVNKNLAWFRSLLELTLPEDEENENAPSVAVGPLISRKRLKRKTPTKDQINLENVLNGFSGFLDRLLEGSSRRYYIPEWPDNLK